MATTTTSRINHDHHHCQTSCHLCGPDADAWALGETVTGVFVGLASLVIWVTRHPGVTLVLLALAATVALASGAA